MIKIRMDTAVYGQDDYCGQVRYLIINPSAWQLTHLAVGQDKLTASHAQTMRLVPREFLSEIRSQAIRLRCTKDAFGQLKPFIQVQFINIDFPPPDFMEMPAWIFPAPESSLMMSIEQQLIPPGEVAISGQTEVEAIDGHVGRFAQLDVNQEDGFITHISFLRGHLWEQKLVTVATTDIHHVEADGIYLHLDKHKVARLPSTPIRP